ncbi:hypothetical protein BDV96DRAFT_642312 [Lophiotrema nucula]|uniref:SET domain-containing protein n=1 Tax=Lophiotrema nucula TaxID=690887 RepID=A0A6A5ZK88_9PLEO|nr:hypothetical protein BDV96DRAFT_642312 [Lophiotrema nucula]
MHPCTDECGKKKGSKARTCDKETCSNIYQDRPLPKCKVKTSTIPGAGKGYFAREDIKKGQLIAKFGGRVVKDRGDHKYDGAMDLFEIAQGYSLKLDHKDAYFVNEAPGDKANAEFLITEGPERREVMLKAKRPIKIDQEIFAAYGPGQFFPWKTDEPDVDNYLQVMGEENGKDVAWLGKVTRVYGPGEFRVQWLLRKEDLSWLPEGLHVELEAGEHIMWHEEQDVGRDHFFRLVHCQEGRPGHLGRNKWWWTRRFDPEAERIVEE